MQVKRLIGYLIVILLSSISLQAQDIISIPDSVAAKIIDELIQKDGLEYKVAMQDSIITVLKINDNKLKQEVNIYKTNEETFRKIMETLNEVIRIREAQIKDLETANKKLKNKGLFYHIGAGILGIVVLVIATK